MENWKKGNTFRKRFFWLQTDERQAPGVVFVKKRNMLFFLWPSNSEQKHSFKNKNNNHISFLWITFCQRNHSNFDTNTCLNICEDTSVLP